MVAESHRPTDPELFHQGGEKLCGRLVVERAGLKGNGIGYVAGHDNKIGLFGGDHCGDGVESLRVFFQTHPPTADMDIRKLKNFKRLIGCESPVSVFVPFRF